MKEVVRIKNRIEKEGWTQGSFKSPTGAVCLIGGVDEECTGNADDQSGNGKKVLHYRFLRAMAKAIDPKTVAWFDRCYKTGRITSAMFDWNEAQAKGIPFHRYDNVNIHIRKYRQIIMSWNDKQGRTKQQVLNLLDKAIEN